MSKPTFADLFCGIGGIRIGMERAGFECVFSCDVNAGCRRTYEANFGETPDGDVREIDPDNMPDFDALCAGFPCQPFSISGKKEGFADARGTLFFEILRISEKKKPKVILLENVKHLVHHDGGRTLKVILESLRNAGYETNWKVMNASDFGVPQHRERIVIVATREGEPFDFETIRKKDRPKLKDFLDESPTEPYLNPDEYVLLENPRKAPSGLVFAGYRKGTLRKRGVKPGQENLSRSHRQPNRIYSCEGIHPTLSSQEISGRFFIADETGKVRKMSVSECLRIMGFPEGFEMTGSASEMRRQIGNSVCAPMFAEIAEQIRKQYFEAEE